MSQSKQEILELVVGLKVIAADVKAVLADGKVDYSDVGVIKELVSQRDELVAAFTGLGNIKREELTGEEAMEILSALVDAAREVAAK